MIINGKLLIAIILCIIFVVVLILILCRKTGKIGYYICNDALTGKVQKEVLNDYGLYLNKTNWLIYVPCGYTRCEFEINNMNVSNNDQKIFMVDGCDNLCSKFRLWAIMNYVYKNKASEILPQSYLSYNKHELNQFWKYYNAKMSKNKYSKFIFKNNKQRQEGIYLLRDKDKIEDLLNKGKYVIQEYLENPFTIIGHKINLRYYVLLVCYPNKKVAYMHYNGFVYYTANKYSEESIDFHSNITSGYIDRKIYETNPLTLQNFYDYLINNGYDYKKYLKNVTSVFVKVFDGTQNVLGINSKFKNNVRFQLFGCDIAPYANLDVRLMEFNKGPDLSAKGPRDHKVKKKVFTDIMNIILDEDHGENQFMKIWEKKLEI